MSIGHKIFKQRQVLALNGEPGSLRRLSEDSWPLLVIAQFEQVFRQPARRFRKGGSTIAPASSGGTVLLQKMAVFISIA